MLRSGSFHRFLLILVLALAADGLLRAEVVINEVMYNSPGLPDVEYVELFNTGPAPRDLDGWYLLDDDDLHDRCLLEGILAPGQFLVVVGDLSLFSASYPGVTGLNANPFDGTGVGFSLGNTSDGVRLFDALDDLVDQVEYADSAPWPVPADGDGPSLELLNPLLDNALATSWAASIDARTDGTPGAQNSTFLADTPPAIGDVKRDPALPGSADTVTVSASITDDAGSVTAELFVDTGTGFLALPMFDDGVHGDGEPLDDIYGAAIAAQADGTLVRYYVSASDGAPQTTTVPPLAPAEFLAYTVGYTPPELVIHELLASNQNGITDGSGDNDDWLELRNPGPDPISLHGKYLSDDLDAPRMWALPNTTLVPGQSIIFWCDDEIAQGPFHTSFRLSRAGGEIGLFDSVEHGNGAIDIRSFAAQSPDVSFGFSPDDADAPEYLSDTTPGATNDGAATFSPVCINEFLARSDLGEPDWVELFNRGASAVDISGWFLSDDRDNLEKYTFPPGSVIAQGGFLSVDQAALGFGLSGDGTEVLALTHADGETGQDYFDFGPQSDDVSQGRFPDGSPDWQFFDPPLRDTSNVCPTIPQLRGVQGVRFDTPELLRWNPLGLAEGYDVIEGDLALLRAGSGDFGAAILDCAENNGPDTLTWIGSSPATGGARFYLVRGMSFSCRFGTYNVSDNSLAADRDAAIAEAPATCP